MKDFMCKRSLFILGFLSIILCAFSTESLATYCGGPSSCPSNETPCDDIVRICDTCHNGKKYRRNPEESCKQDTSKHSCGYESCSSYSTCDGCTPPPCRYDNGTDKDKDGWDMECGDGPKPVISTGYTCPDNADSKHKSKIPGKKEGELIFPDNPELNAACLVGSKIGSTIQFNKFCRCTDGLDNDCDGLVDTDDPDCPADPTKALVIVKDAGKIVLNIVKKLEDGLWLQGGDVDVRADLTVSGRGITLQDRSILRTTAKIIMEKRLSLEDNSLFVADGDIFINAGGVELKRGSKMVIRPGKKVHLNKSFGVFLENDNESKIILCPDANEPECGGISGPPAEILFN